jgi:cytochrome P450
MANVPIDGQHGTTDTETVDVDPFERFSRAQGAGSIRTPYPRWAELRSQAPIVRIKLRELMGANPNPIYQNIDFEILSAVSYQAVFDILCDSKHFSSSLYAMSMGPVMGHTILEMDPPEHTAQRGLIQQAFTRKGLEHWEAALVRPVIDRMIDGFAARGRVDLVRELTFPFPVSVIAGMMGLPQEAEDDFHRWAVELISVSFDVDLATAASKKLTALFAELLTERRRSPREDLISLLAQAELDDGSRLDDEAIFAFLRLLTPAGAETTYRSSSNLVFGLLSNRDQLEALQADRALMAQAIEEGVRWECPLTGIMRIATADTEVCGVPIEEGSVVHICLGSANHDEMRWENAEAFDILREPRPNMAFAAGPHTCLGMHLARVETRVLLEALFERLPNLRIDPDADDIHVTGFMFRSPLSLPVVFDPA